MCPMTSDPTLQPTYDLATHTWSRDCPCIRAEQRDPECPWHGRLTQQPDPDYAEVLAK